MQETVTGRTSTLHTWSIRQVPTREGKADCNASVVPDRCDEYGAELVSKA